MFYYLITPRREDFNKKTPPQINEVAFLLHFFLKHECLFLKSKYRFADNITTFM
jgi:hypothetical protein